MESPEIIDSNENHSLEAQTASKGKKKGKKCSKGMKEFQRMERAASKAERRMVGAVMKGLKSWDGKREKSSRKRKDGAIRDAVSNASWAFGKMVGEAAKAPNDLSRIMKPEFGKKAEKRLMKSIRGIL